MHSCKCDRPCAPCNHASMVRHRRHRHARTSSGHYLDNSGCSIDVESHKHDNNREAFINAGPHEMAEPDRVEELGQVKRENSHMQVHALGYVNLECPAKCHLKALVAPDSSIPETSLLGVILNIAQPCMASLSWTMFCRGHCQRGWWVCPHPSQVSVGELPCCTTLGPAM